MNKKIKIASVIAALLVCSAAAGCSKQLEENDNIDDNTAVKDAETEQASTANNDENESEVDADAEGVKGEDNKASENGVKTELLHCYFTETLYASDLESVGQYYQDTDGEIYVDLAIAVENNSDTTFGSSNLSGYFMYDDLRHDMAFAYEDETCSSINVVTGAALAKDSIAAGKAGVVHLVGSIEKRADITVCYTVNGKEYTQPVELYPSLHDKSYNKTKVNVGDKLNVNGLYDIEIISCKKKSYITTQDTANGAQYEPTEEGKDFFDLVLKVKNNSKNDLKSIYGYTLIDDEYTPASVDIEGKALVGDQLSLVTMGSGFSNYITPGEEKYVHIYTLVDKDSTGVGLSMRFNLGNKLYYCPVVH